jgi:hypothetical protein
MGYYTMQQEKTLVPVKYLLSPNAEIIHDIVLLWSILPWRVLGDLEGTNHQNIRNFMKSGWDGAFLRWSSSLKIIKKLQ